MPRILLKEDIRNPDFDSRARTAVVDPQSDFKALASDEKFEVPFCLFGHNVKEEASSTQ